MRIGIGTQKQRGPFSTGVPSTEAASASGSPRPTTTLPGTFTSCVAEIDEPGSQNRCTSTSVWCELSTTAMPSTAVIAVRQTIARISVDSDTTCSGSTCGSQLSASVATRGASPGG